MIERNFEVNDVIPYNNLEISYNEESGINIRDYAIKTGKGKFLLAVGGPDELSLAFKFSSDHNVTYIVKPLYPDWICKKQGWNYAKLSLCLLYTSPSPRDRG